MSYKLMTFGVLCVFGAGILVGVCAERGIPVAQADTMNPSQSEFPIFHTHTTCYDEIVGISYLFTDEYGQRHAYDAWVPIYSLNVEARKDGRYITTVALEPLKKRRDLQQKFQRATIYVPEDQIVQWRARIWNIRTGLQPWNRHPVDDGK